MCAVVGKEAQHFVVEVLSSFFYSYLGLCGTLAGLYLPFKRNGRVGRLVHSQGYLVVLILSM